MALGRTGYVGMIVTLPRGTEAKLRALYKLLLCY